MISLISAVLGIMCLLAGFLGLISLLFFPVGIVFGILGLVRAGKDKQNSKTGFAMSLAGLIASILGIGLLIWAVLTYLA